MLHVFIIVYIYISYGDDDDDDNDNYYSDGGNTRIKTRRWREDINPGSGGGRERLYFNARALLMYYLSRSHIIIGHAEEMKSLMRIFFPTSFFAFFSISHYSSTLSLSLSLFLSDTLSLLFLSLSLSLSPTRFLYYDILVVVVEIYSRRRLRRNPPPTLYTVAQLRQKKITPVQLQTYRYRGRERTRSVSGGGAVG